MFQITTWIVLYFAFANCQEVPDVEPPIVEINTYSAFTACTATNRGAVFCNGQGDNYCTSTETVECQGLNIARTKVACSGATPYCVDEVSGTPLAFAGRAQCMATASLTFTALTSTPQGTDRCTIPVSAFTCTQSGVFPDIGDCRGYFFCPSDFGNATSFKCPENYAFDPSLPDAFPCRFTRNRADLCITASCPGPGVLRYPNLTPSMGQYGYYCIETAKFVHRCGPNSQFVSNTAPSCSSVCVTEGQRNADADNPSQYTVCHYNALGNQLLRITMDCPRNYTYDAKRNECVQDLSRIENVVDTLCPTDRTTRTPANDCPIRT